MEYENYNCVVLILVLLDVPIGVIYKYLKINNLLSLNPCFTGCSYRRIKEKYEEITNNVVLILVLLDVPIGAHKEIKQTIMSELGLNPCFTGCSYRSQVT